MAAKPLAQLGEEVLRILADRGYADYTVKRYGEHFRTFPRWTDEEGRALGRRDW